MWDCLAGSTQCCHAPRGGLFASWRSSEAFFDASDKRDSVNLGIHLNSSFPTYATGSTTLKMPIPLAILLNLPPPLHPPSRTPRKPIRTSKPHTLPRTHRSARRAPEHARPKSTRRHLHESASPQLARKRCDLRRQTRWQRAVCSCEWRWSRSQIAWVKSERRDGSRCRDGSEAACSARARRCAHVSWRPRGVRD